MFQAQVYKGTKQENYETLAKQLDALLLNEPDMIANLSNAAALLNQFLDKINWDGFYLWKNDQLVLGPFQGLPACIRIPKGKGVCGTVAEKQQTIRVPDVQQFPGHIVCDINSKSEIVLPLLKEGKLVGVLDIDSPIIDRFSAEDEKGLQLFVTTLIKHI